MTKSATRIWSAELFADSPANIPTNATTPAMNAARPTPETLRQAAFGSATSRRPANKVSGRRATAAVMRPTNCRTNGPITFRVANPNATNPAAITTPIMPATLPKTLKATTPPIDTNPRTTSRKALSSGLEVRAATPSGVIETRCRLLRAESRATATTATTVTSNNGSPTQSSATLNARSSKLSRVSAGSTAR